MCGWVHQLCWTVSSGSAWGHACMAGQSRSTFCLGKDRVASCTHPHSRTHAVLGTRISGHSLRPKIHFIKICPFGPSQLSFLCLTTHIRLILNVCEYLLTECGYQDKMRCIVEFFKKINTHCIWNRGSTSVLSTMRRLITG